MMPQVTIYCYREGALPFQRGYAVIAVDVIRATTTLATAVSKGRRCFPVASREAANQLSARLSNPLLAGELGGVLPPGFEINNSPAELNRRTDTFRPLILLSSSGTRLIDRCREHDAVYLACLRNFRPAADCVAGQHSDVAIVGAATRGEFREEDQICAAWIAQHLLGKGFAPADHETEAVINRWAPGSIEGVLNSASADYLIRSGQGRDLEFVLSHIADLEHACFLDGNEVVEAGAPNRQFAAAQG